MLSLRYENIFDWFRSINTYNKINIPQLTHFLSINFKYININCKPKIGFNKYNIRILVDT